MNRSLINKGLIAAAVMNISGVLIFSRGFTDSTINTADPLLMSNFGLLMIVVWGLAYLSASTIKSNIKWLAGVFALEKLIYFVFWVLWLLGNDLSEVYSKDVFAGIFYSIYGVNDLMFMVFFVAIFLSNNAKPNET